MKRTVCLGRVAGHFPRFQGKSNRWIAEELSASRHTVDAHLKQVYLKLDVRSRVELTVLALQHRLPIG